MEIRQETVTISGGFVNENTCSRSHGCHCGISQRVPTMFKKKRRGHVCHKFYSILRRFQDHVVLVQVKVFNECLKSCVNLAHTAGKRVSFAAQRTTAVANVPAELKMYFTVSFNSEYLHHSVFFCHYSQTSSQPF
jgi:hypothetical protein